MSTESQQTNERRRFSRIPFEAQSHLNSHKGDLHLNCHVIDISLTGLLISRPEGWQGSMADHYDIDLLLDNAQLVIKMEAEVAHITDTTIGFNCTNIDLDSISHLKRLVELNLGDPALLQRELSALID